MTISFTPRVCLRTSCNPPRVEALRCFDTQWIMALRRPFAIGASLIEKTSLYASSATGNFISVASFTLASIVLARRASSTIDAIITKESASPAWHIQCPLSFAGNTTPFSFIGIALFWYD